MKKIESTIIQQDLDLARHDTAVIIVNWNGKKYLQQCLTSLQGNEAAGIIIVDNGSDDGSVEYLTENFPHVALIRLEENTGFAYANNIGIAHAFQSQNNNIKYIITLNNDTEVDSNYITQMRACAVRHESDQCGSVQAKVLDFTDRTIIDSVGILTSFELSALNRGRLEKDEGQYDAEEEVLGASASAALYTREALEDVQLSDGEYFDNMYFAYYEDVDLMWRLQLSGYKSFYTPHARVYHIHSATGKSYSPFKSFHIHRNHFYNIIKNMPLLGMVAVLIFMPVRYILLLLSIVTGKGASAKLMKNTQKIKKQNTHFRENILGIVLYSWKDIVMHVPVLLRKRRTIQSQKKIPSKEFYAMMKKHRVSLRKVIFG